MLIAIDHGNKLVKVPNHAPFTSGLQESETPPYGGETLKYKDDEGIPYHIKMRGIAICELCPAFYFSVATAMKLSIISSRCRYCAGERQAIFCVRMEWSVSDIFPSRR